MDRRPYFRDCRRFPDFVERRSYEDRFLERPDTHYDYYPRHLGRRPGIYFDDFNVEYTRRQFYPNSYIERNRENIFLIFDRLLATTARQDHTLLKYPKHMR